MTEPLTGPTEGTGDEGFSGERPLRAYQPPPPAPSPGADPALRAQARKRLAEKNDFRIHLMVYGLVMALLVLIWLLTGGIGSYFWPVWPMLGWGLAVAIHAVTLRWDSAPTEEQITEEARRIALQRGHRPTDPGTPQD